MNPNSTPSSSPEPSQEQLHQRLKTITESGQEIAITTIAKLHLDKSNAYIIFSSPDDKEGITIIFGDGRRFVPGKEVERLGTIVTHMSIDKHGEVIFYRNEVPVHIQKPHKIVEVARQSAEPLLGLKPLVPYDAQGIIDPAARVAKIIPFSHIEPSHIEALKSGDMLVTAGHTTRTFVRRDGDGMIFRMQKALFLDRDSDDTYLRKAGTMRDLSLDDLSSIAPGTTMYSVQLHRDVSFVSFDVKRRMVVVDFEERRTHLPGTTGLHILDRAA